MFCKKCGAEIALGNRFCTACGNEVDEETLSMVQNAINSREYSEGSINTVPEVVYPTSSPVVPSNEPEEQMIFVSDVVAENKADDNNESINFPEIDKSALQIEYNDAAENISPKEEPAKEDTSPYADYLAKHPNAYVGNKKYVSVDSIKNSSIINDADNSEENTGLNGLEDGQKAKATKSKGKNNTILIVVIVVTVVLLIIACGVFAFFQFKDQLFGSKDDEYQEELYEPEEIEEVETVEAVESDYDDENQEDATQDSKEETAENESDVADGSDEIADDTTSEDVSDETGDENSNTQEIVSTGSFNINVDLPDNIQFVSADDRTIQYVNSESNYSIIIDLNPDSSILTGEHCSELIKNMIPISYHGNVAILIYDETDQYNNIDSFAQPFIEKYYPDVESPFALAAEICHDDMTMDYSIYVGGAFSEILPDNDTYDRFDVKVNEYGSVSKGFLFTLGDWLYERGYDLPGYSGDHSMYSVNINQGPLKMREEPSSESMVVTLIEAGTIVSVYNESDGWYCVRLGDDIGWVKAEYCSVIQY